jgi:hypothetical protein
MSSDDDFHVRPGRVRDGGARHGRRLGRRSRTLAAQVRRAAAVRRGGRQGPGSGGEPAIAAGAGQRRRARVFVATAAAW